MARLVGRESGEARKASGADRDGNVRPNPFGSGRKGPNIGLKDMNGDLLVEALDAALDAGVLVSLGRTSDGGAIGCYVLDDGARYKAWAADPDGLQEVFENLREAYRPL